MKSNIEKQWRKEYNAEVSYFQRQNCENIVAVYDEGSFRYHFESLCLEHQESDTIRLLAKLQASLGHVESFRLILKGLRLEDGSFDPSQLLWGGTFAVIETGYTSFGHGTKDPDSLEGLTDLLCTLNSAVPSFEPLTENTAWEAVQKHLKNICICFTRTCLFLVCYFRGLNIAGVHSSISSAEYVHGSINEMTIEKGLFDLAVNEADTERNPATGLLSSISSMPLLLDYTLQHPLDDRAQLKHVKRLGNGGFGEVTKVEVSSGQTFARKAIRFTTYEDDPVRNDEETLRRESVVQDEVAIMQKLRHIHVATVLFTVRERESFDFVMLPVADRDLNSFLLYAKHSLIAKQEILSQWMGCLTNALAFAHEQNVRHKDIKPSNILVKGDQVLLTDFGLAVDFSTAEVSYTTNHPGGTHHYRAPESRRGTPHGRAADVFSLGCVFVEMLTIIRGKLLSSFDKERRGELYSEDNAYYLNLPAVRNWVHDLEGDDTHNFLVQHTIDMLQEDPYIRTKATQLREGFEQRGLCCNTCREYR